MLDRCRLAVLFDDGRTLAYAQAAGLTLREQHASNPEAARHHADGCPVLWWLLFAARPGRCSRLGRQTEQISDLPGRFSPGASVFCFHQVASVFCKCTCTATPGKRRDGAGSRGCLAAASALVTAGSWGCAGNWRVEHGRWRQPARQPADFGNRSSGRIVTRLLPLMS